MEGNVCENSENMYQQTGDPDRYTIKYPMMRFVYRIINLFRGRRSQKPAPVVPVLKEDYERWLGI